LPGEAPRYERGGEAHHHHFQCTSCQRVYNLQGCLGGMERLLPRGFRLDSHDLQLTGTCAQCGSSACI
jgi:Fur family ferric uptake transcriptional regulator